MTKIFNATADNEPVVLADGLERAGVIAIKGRGETGLQGEATGWCGVIGLSSSTTGGFGVYGKNTAGGTGVVGESDGWMGVYGKSASTTGGAGVMGEATGPGVIGKSATWMGVYGETASTTGGSGVWGEHKNDGTGTVGKSAGGVGVFGVSETNEGVHAETNSPVTAALAAFNNNPTGTGAAVYAKKAGTDGHAGFFDGRVWVAGELGVGGDIQLANADCAEDFDVVSCELAEPGTVMVVGADGILHPCSKPYDKRVAGVISGGGSYSPALILDKHPSLERRSPLALLGKVYCKASTIGGPIEVGDLLTTSRIHGHAMKVSDARNAFGAVVGKALEPLREESGLVAILVALQ